MCFLIWAENGQNGVTAFKVIDSSARRINTTWITRILILKALQLILERGWVKWEIVLFWSKLIPKCPHADADCYCACENVVNEWMTSGGGSGLAASLPSVCPRRLWLWLSGMTDSCLRWSASRNHGGLKSAIQVRAIFIVIIHAFNVQLLHTNEFKNMFHLQEEILTRWGQKQQLSAVYEGDREELFLWTKYTVKD